MSSSRVQQNKMIALAKKLFDLIERDAFTDCPDTFDAFLEKVVSELGKYKARGERLSVKMIIKILNSLGPKQAIPPSVITSLNRVMSQMEGLPPERIAKFISSFISKIANLAKYSKRSRAARTRASRSSRASRAIQSEGGGVKTNKNKMKSRKRVNKTKKRRKKTNKTKRINKYQSGGSLLGTIAGFGMVVLFAGIAIFVISHIWPDTWWPRHDGGVQVIQPQPAEVIPLQTMAIPVTDNSQVPPLIPVARPRGTTPPGAPVSTGIVVGAAAPGGPFSGQVLQGEPVVDATEDDY